MRYRLVEEPTATMDTDSTIPKDTEKEIDSKSSASDSNSSKKFTYEVSNEDETSNENNPKYEWPPSRDVVEKFRKMTSPDQIEFLKTNILTLDVFKKVSALSKLIVDSALIYGLDPRRNDFIDFVTKLDIEMTEQSYLSKMTYVYNSFKNNKLDLKKTPVLFNPSLYVGRDDKEFQYTLNCFNLLPKTASVYLKSTKNVDVTLFLKGGENLATSKIKKAGIYGESGDTIFNVIEGWAKGNERSKEEIADRKAAADTSHSGNVSILDGTDVKWSYEYFKTILEKVFSSRNGYTIGLNNKNDYLERVYSVFELSKLVFDNAHSNVIENKDTATLKDTDVKKFGNPQIVDEPIYLTVKNGNTQTNGVYLFHKFLDLSDNAKHYYEQQSRKLLGTLKRAITEVNPANISDVKSFYQSILYAIEKLPKLYRK